MSLTVLQLLHRPLYRGNLFRPSGLMFQRLHAILVPTLLSIRLKNSLEFLLKRAMSRCTRKAGRSIDQSQSKVQPREAYSAQSSVASYFQKTTQAPEVVVDLNSSEEDQIQISFGENVEDPMAPHQVPRRASLHWIMQEDQ